MKISSVSPIDKVESFFLLFKMQFLQELANFGMYDVGYSGEMCLIMQCGTIGSAPYRAFICTCRRSDVEVIVVTRYSETNWYS